MKQYIRWSGLGIFAVISILLAAFFIFAAGPLLKYAIESAGSAAAGAKVEVTSVKLGFDPLTLDIRGVQIADKDAPMTNLMGFQRALVNVEFFPLLLGQGIMDDVALEGVAFNTPRKTSGALPKPPALTAAEKAALEKEKAEEAANGFNLSVELPSADEILAREPLATVQQGEAFQQAFKTHQADINARLAAVPDTSALQQYEKELKQITSGKFKSVEDFEKRKKAFEALQQRFKNDQLALQQARDAIKAGKQELSSLWPLLKDAPGQDFATLKNKYTADALGASNLSALLFGSEAGYWAKQGLYYYAKLKPLLVSDKKELAAEQKRKRVEGRFVVFPSDKPQPGFWLKNLHFDAALAIGQVDVRVTDITSEQAAIGRATVATVTGQNLPAISQLVARAVFDHRGAQGRDDLELSISDWRVKGLDLGMAGLKMQQASLNLRSHASITGGELSADGRLSVNNSQFSSKDKTLLAKELLGALQQVQNFSVDAAASGKLSAPDTRMSSDLDEQLNNAFNARIKQKQQQLEQELRNKLNEKLLAYAGDYQQQVKDLNLTEGSLDEKGKALQQLAKSELADYEKQLKDEANAKAKAEADKKQKELEKKAKDKLKKLL